MVGDVGLTDVDGAFTLGGAAGTGCVLSVGTTLGGVLSVMILMRLVMASTWRNFCSVESLSCCVLVSCSDWYSSFAV